MEFRQPDRTCQPQVRLKKPSLFPHSLRRPFRRGQQGGGIVVVIVHKVENHRQEPFKARTAERAAQEAPLELPDRLVVQVAFISWTPFFRQQPLRKPVQKTTGGHLEGFGDFNEPGDGLAAGVEDIAGRCQALRHGHIVGCEGGGGEQGVGGVWQVFEADGGAPVGKLGAGQYRQGKDVQVIGVERQGKVKAAAETCQGIAGQAVDQVEAEYGAALVKQVDPRDKVVGPERASNPLQHPAVGALQADLQRASDLSEESGQFRVD